MPPQDNESPLGGPLELPEDNTTHQPPAPQQTKPRRKVGKTAIIILAIALVLVAGGLLAWKLTKPKSNTAQNSNSNAQTADTAKTDLPASTGTKAYKNDIMRLSFTYPDNWTVTEDKGTVTVVSPEFSYKSSDKGDVTGHFKLYVRQGAQTEDSKYIGKGVAIMPSEKLVYTNPAPSQRKDTNLSFFGIDTPDNFNYFLIAGNFDLKKGDTLGPNYGKEADTFIIGGGYSAKDLKEGLAMNNISVDQFQQSAAYKQAIDILKSIQIQ